MSVKGGSGSLEGEGKLLNCTRTCIPCLFSGHELYFGLLPEFVLSPMCILHITDFAGV